MHPTDASSLGGELETTLRLLHQLVVELEAVKAKLGGMGRVREILAALSQRPHLAELPQMMLEVYAEIAEALHGIRLSRETIRSYSIDRLRDTQARLSEVSSTTESAAMEMLNGLDRSLATIDGLERALGGGAAPAPGAFDALRHEMNQLYGHLQFQDITSQQLRGVEAMLVEVEQRMEAVAALFDSTGARLETTAAGGPDPRSYNPDATVRDVAGRQALIDAAFTAARSDGASRAPLAG